MSLGSVDDSVLTPSNREYTVTPHAGTNGLETNVRKVELEPWK